MRWPWRGLFAASQANRLAVMMRFSAWGRMSRGAPGESARGCRQHEVGRRENEDHHDSEDCFFMSPVPGAEPPWLISQVRASLNPVGLSRALADIRSGLLQWPLWGYLGYHDIRQRYRRSMLGPLWITISMGVMVGALGLLYGTIFKQDISNYLPYLATGFVVWGFISSLITDGMQVFSRSESVIRQMAAPLSVYVYREIWANLVIFAHNMAIYVLVAIWFGVKVNDSLLLVPAGLLLLLVNGVWIGILLGLLSARFRDIPLIVQNVVQVVFFLTPIIWRPEMLPERSVFVDANPLYHLVEIIRAPLLGHAPAMESWWAVLSLTVVGWVLTLLFYSAYRWRIPYWV